MIVVSTTYYDDLVRLEKLDDNGGASRRNLPTMTTQQGLKLPQHQNNLGYVIGQNKPNTQPTAVYFNLSVEMIDTMLVIMYGTELLPGSLVSRQHKCDLTFQPLIPPPYQQREV
jgi:hypothetical protein